MCTCAFATTLNRMLAFLYRPYSFYSFYSMIKGAKAPEILKYLFCSIICSWLMQQSELSSLDLNLDLCPETEDIIFFIFFLVLPTSDQ